MNEFHIEDLNPTLNKKRTVAISRLLIQREIHITWKLAQGTKLESLDNETITWMAKAGCNYVSISPESGSRYVLRLMDKPVNIEYSVEMIRLMKQNGIYTQACFVIGYPGERKSDLKKTATLVRRLARSGVDEVALFMITPMPGSRIFKQYHGDNLPPLDQLTFTPKWRSNYKKLSTFRKRLYLNYIAIKLLYHPLRAFGYGWALMTRRFRTKVEMTIFRKLKVTWFVAFCKENFQ